MIGWIVAWPADENHPDIDRIFFGHGLITTMLAPDIALVMPRDDEGQPSSSMVVRLTDPGLRLFPTAEQWEAWRDWVQCLMTEHGDVDVASLKPEGSA